MKIIAAWVVALAMVAGTGTAIAFSVKPQRTVSEEHCVGLGCWPDTPAMKHRPGQRSNVTSQVAGPELAAGTIDRSGKGDRITVVRTSEATVPAECEPPFSPLAKLPSPEFIARCVT